MNDEWRDTRGTTYRSRWLELRDKNARRRDRTHDLSLSGRTLYPLSYPSCHLWQPGYFWRHRRSCAQFPPPLHFCPAERCIFITDSLNPFPGFVFHSLNPFRGIHSLNPFRGIQDFLGMDELKDFRDTRTIGLSVSLIDWNCGTKMLGGGFEPTTFRYPGERSTHWAIRAVTLTTRIFL